MSLDSCVNAALNAKVISREDAEVLLSAKGMDETEVIEAALSAAYLARRQTAIQIVKQTEALEKITSYKRRKIMKSLRQFNDVQESDIAAGIDALVSRDAYSQVGWQNVAGQTDVIEGVFDAMLSEILHKHKTKWFGLTQDQDGLKNLVEAMFSGKLDGEYGAMAKSLSETFEYARMRFNKAGGAIRKLDGYMPQTHNVLKMARYVSDSEKSANEWADYIIPRVEKLKDKNGVDLDDARNRDEILKIYRTITTNGVSKQEIDPTDVSGKFGGNNTGMVSNKHQAERVLHFKDAKSWLSYHQEYGSDDILNTLTSHLTGMAKDTAAMEVLGSNPLLTHKMMMLKAEQEEVGAVRLGLSDALFKTQTGYSNEKQSLLLAAYSTEAKAVTTSVMLGSAMLSSIADPVLASLTAAYNGIPVTKVMGGFLKNLANQEDSAVLATELGFIANQAKGKMIALSRLSGDGGVGTGLGSKSSEFVLRSSGLTSWTETLRYTYTLEASKAYGRAQAKSFDQLDANMRNQFTKYGIDADSWELIRGVELDQKDKGGFLTGQSILNATGDTKLADSYQGMILQEALYAALTPDAKARIAAGGSRRGTISGEVISHTMGFKSFPVTMMLTHMTRGMQAQSAKGASAYLGGLVLGTTIMGGLAMQLKELEKGRNLRSIDDSSFWKAAMLQGGGLGLFGDFIFADNSRYGQSAGVTVGGASFSLGAGALKSLGNQATYLGEMYEDPDNAKQIMGKMGAEATEFVKKYNPVDTWQTRLMFERVLFEPIGTFLDPELEGRLQRKQNLQRANYGNDMLMPRGQGLQELSFGEAQGTKLSELFED